MFENVCAKAYVTFRNVSATFSKEDWKTLEEWQKELYKNVLSEIHNTLIAMGHKILNPTMLVRIEEEQRLPVEDCQTSQKKRKLNTCSNSCTIQNPDVSLRVKHEEKLNLTGHHKEKEEDDSLDILVPSGDAMSTSAFSLPIKEEEVVPMTTSAFSLPIKEEEELYPICQKRHRREINVRQTKAVLMKDEKKEACSLSIKECMKKIKLCKTIVDKDLATFLTVKGVYAGRKTDSIAKCETGREQQYKCYLCQKTFENPCSLKVHESSHSKERPFQCYQCHKSYRDNAHLLVHQWSHG
ncbi:zinc finger protein 425-like isoform X3 [Ascaphus truei]|uniref:zinc finger protein 425-like isoform X3 n=1 Tax=Ascaphus truei TaxID=8439 RepID=UPI003F5A388E